MSVAENDRADSTDFEVKSHDVKIILGYAVSAIALLIAIYAASMSPGTAPAEFASMSFFP
jgi:hypothetical protein